MNIFLLSSVTSVDRSPFRNPPFACCACASGAPSNRNDAARSVSKNDSSSSSASTTIRNLRKRTLRCKLARPGQHARGDVEVWLVGPHLGLLARLLRWICVARVRRLLEHLVAVFECVCHESADRSEVGVADLIPKYKLKQGIEARQSGHVGGRPTNKDSESCKTSSLVKKPSLSLS